MLRPDPARQHRLEAVITSLSERIAEANERGWLGEADGLQTRLDAAEQQPIHIRRTAINLGLSILHSPKPRRSTR
jgi:hypothetical protein